MKKKKKTIDIHNIIFLSICFLILLVGMFTLVKTQTSVSSSENRVLKQFPHFTISSFINSSFQNDFDTALSDQFVLSQTIKTKARFSTMFTDYANLNPKICKNRYVKIDDNYGIFNCSDSIIYNPLKYEKEDETNTIKRMEQVKEAVGDKAELYYYVVDNPYIFDFTKNEKVYDLSKHFDKNYGEFTFKDYDEYLKYFYKTDHHWNYKGSYKGYTEMVKMMLGKDEEIIKPEKTINFKLDFYGSAAQVKKIMAFKDVFKAYKFDIDDHDEYVNGALGKYGNYELYLEGKGPISNTISHYSNYYGDDKSEVIYDFYNNKDKDNLLIIGNSYKSAVSLLLASHFHKTYAVDLRYYENYFNTNFDYQKYITSHEIDKVILIGDYNQFSHLNLGIDKESK